MVYKFAVAHPKQWYKLLPFVLWCLRKKPSATIHVSPYTLIFGNLPRGLSAILNDPGGKGGIRLAVDFCHVNRYSEGDRFPKPDIPIVLQRVSGSRYINCFDARSGYWQILIKP